jgi:hypothetical protein
VSYFSTILADTPLAYYRLGETTGVTASDSSGNLQNGTYQNSPTLGKIGALRDGDTDFATFFNGVSTQTVLTPSLGTVSNFSLELFTYFQGGATQGTAIQLFSSGAARACRLIIRAGVPGSNGCYWGVSPANGTENANQPSSGTNSSVWVHWVGTYDGTAHTSNIFRNGVLLAQNTGLAAGTLDLTSTTANVIGPNFNGIIDEVSFYNVALTQAQVTAHFNASDRLSVSLNNYKFISVGDGMSTTEKVR